MATLAALLAPTPGRAELGGLGGLVAAVLGVEDGSLTVRVDRVQLRGDHVSVGLDVCHGPGAGARRDYLVASDAPAALAAARAGRGVLAKPGGQPGSIALWRHPADPELPGLALACTLARVRQLAPAAVALTVLTYRPLRRAVVRVDGPDGAPLAFLKVVPPRRLEDLRARHGLVSGAPRLLDAGPLAPGVLALAPLGGRPLTDALVEGAAVPQLRRLRPRAVAGAPESVAPDAWAEAVNAQLRAGEALLTPDVVTRLRALADVAAASWLRHRDAVAAPAFVHGDLHPGNVMVDGDVVVGHLDADRAGTGLAADDDACLLAHTELLALEHPRARPALANWWVEVAGRGEDALAATRARTVAVLLSLVPVLPRRAGDVIDLAEHLLGTAHKEEEQ